MADVPVWPQDRATDITIVPGWRTSHDGVIATRSLRDRAVELASRKLAGDRRTAALAFLRSGWRRQQHLEAFIRRVEPLPDIE